MNIENGVAICKLCLKPAQLKQSHIIPSSLHKILKDEGKNVRFVLPGTLTVKNQTDLKELMLCNDCEQEFSKFEKKTIELLRPLWKSTKSGKFSYTVPASSTNMILRFVHSVFWRASASTMLSKYKLDVAIEESLRTSILHNESLNPPLLPIRLDFFTYLQKFDSQNIMQSPGMYEMYPGYMHSAFVTLGIIFTMISPKSSDIVDLSPYVSAGAPYTISAGPIFVQAPCIAAVNEIQKLAVDYAKSKP